MSFLGNGCGFGGGDSWIWVLIIFFLIICCCGDNNGCGNIGSGNNNCCDPCCDPCC